MELSSNLREVEDDFNGEFDELSSSPLITSRKLTATPQMSTATLIPSESLNFLATANDEGSNISSSSSISSNPLGIAPDTEDNLITKCRTISLASTSNSLHDDDKEKLDEKRKKSSLQNFRLYNLQMEQRSLNKQRSMEVLPSLTSAQIHLIRNIWRQVYVTKGPTLIGSTLLHGMFFKSKKIKEQFFRCPFPHCYPNRDSFNKAHAKAIGKMLDKIVDNLENLDAISPYFFSIGAVHTNLTRQMSKEVWNLMAETFIDCTLDWGDKKGRTEASRKAWAFIISFVIEKIKVGHLYERRQSSFRRRSSIMILPSQTEETTALTSLPSSAPTVEFWKSMEEFEPPVQML
ncbi:unnamed protein product [Cercopithifilaria johnstoni]|uniref:Globin domain-containing protein n=1 Tax=Cercopithifilaria johnstoni TaxID=2874296 RepID=A0A8J2LVZ5_9BILA|nr:unnamed protein product [Cercopithifilaria johnstoni]